MEFPKEELLEKYVRLREQYVDSRVPDFDTAGDEIGYVRFNDAWQGLNPYSRFLLPRLTNRRNTFPKKPSKKLAKNANPENYVTLYFDPDGKLKTARLGENSESEMIIEYVSENLTIEYLKGAYPGHEGTFCPVTIEWSEYDESGRLTSVESFEFRGGPSDDVKINCEYYEYDNDVLSHAWNFRDFYRYPMQMVQELIKWTMPDRIANPDQIEYIFVRTAQGLDYTRNHFYRKSQTITNQDHVSEETLLHLEEEKNFLTNLVYRNKLKQN